MEGGSRFRQSRRDVLGLVVGTGTLTMAGSIRVAAQRIQLPVAHSDSPSASPPAERQIGPPPRSHAWTQLAKLAANDGDSEDLFGKSVAVSEDGTVAIVGASEERDSAGSAYVFEPSGEEWSQQAKLVAGDVDRSDDFPVAVSSDGTTAIVGARDDSSPNGNLAGSAYVFEASGGEWSQQAKLAADDGDSGDAFGESVALSDDGTTAFVAARNEEGPNGGVAGSLYVFEASGGEWSQQAKLVPEESGDRFGTSVAVSGDGTTAIVGAYHDEPNGIFSGSAYVFEASGDEWSQEAKLAADDGDSEDRFGWSVAVSGDGTTAIVGAVRDEDPNGRFSGSAYVFEQDGGEWTQRTKLTADDGDSGDVFGDSVGMSDDGTTVIIGARRDEDPNGEAAGSAYVFEGTSGEWRQRAKLLPNDGDSDDFFGSSVAVSGDGTTAIIGAQIDEDPNGIGAGSAYVFETEQQVHKTTTISTDVATTERTATTDPGDEMTQRPTTADPGMGTTESSTTADPDDETIEGTTDKGADDGTGGSTPGFGVGTLLAALTGTGYLLWSEGGDDTDQ